MNIAAVKEYLGRDWERTLSFIQEALSSDIPLLDSVNASILSCSGKQLRPVLSLLCARLSLSAQGRPVVLPSDSIRYAAASELLHNATLLHDDVADQSDRRRGKPTVNALMGASTSVLVGDYWLSKAVDCILGAQSYSKEVTKVFSSTLCSLAEGEMLQLQKASDGDTDRDDYMRIIYCKTASLFETTARSAVIGVGGPVELQQRLADFAVKLGLAFQIRDDIFDYSLEANVGKPVGADILERKITLPLLLALDKVDPEKQKDIRDMVSSIKEKPENRNLIVEFVHENKGQEDAQKVLESIAESALKQLEPLPQTGERKFLEQLAEFVGSRRI